MTMLADVLHPRQPHPSTEGWRYLASLARALSGANDRQRICYVAPLTTTPSVADGLDTDTAWVLGLAQLCPALRPPQEAEVRRLDADLAQVCAAVDSSELRDRKISLRVICPPMALNGWRSWQICVLVANLLLEATRNSRDVRSIAVEFALTEDASCVVIDDGVALPSSADAREVNGLVAEMGGEVVRISDDSGSAIMVRVPKAAL